MSAETIRPEICPPCREGIHDYCASLFSLGPCDCLCDEDEMICVPEPHADRKEPHETTKT